jgi:hypothetical protein
MGRDLRCRARGVVAVWVLCARSHRAIVDQRRVDARPRLGHASPVTRVSTCLAAVVVLAAVAGCSTSTVITPVALGAITISPAPGAGGSTARPTDGSATADDRRPVPAPVADMHRKIFAPSGTPLPGEVQCLLTVHDGRLSHEKLHVLVLFADGAVATWTHALDGPVEPFLARLTPEEVARSRASLDEIASHRGAARDRFLPSTTVLGISARPGDRVETSYFASEETPEALDRLVQLLKRRLEATNARSSSR